EPYSHSSKFIQFKVKLKRLKERIKDWRTNRPDPSLASSTLHSEILEIDALIDGGKGNEALLNRRLAILKKIEDIEKPLRDDLAQKAKIRWGKFGDENSKFFHGVINSKRRKLAINGLKVDGAWVEDPKEIKKAFVSYFADKFKSGNELKVINKSVRFRSLSDHDRASIELLPSVDEIKAAIWDCGSEKAPGPD
ncbi:hypothetical protein SSX86_033205, partial [Deinandra increscens subsp. villosa]